MLGALLDLHCDVVVVLEVLGQPHSREVAPAELLNDHVSLEENFAHMHRVVAARLVVGHAFVLTAVLILVEALPQLVLQRSEISFLVLFARRASTAGGRDSLIALESVGLSSSSYLV